MPARISRLLLASTLLATLPLRAQTASLVRDIAQTISPPQLPSSLPQDLFVFHGKLFYSAEEPSAGRELWVSDGQGHGLRRQQLRKLAAGRDLAQRRHAGGDPQGGRSGRPTARPRAPGWSAISIRTLSTPTRGPTPGS